MRGIGHGLLLHEGSGFCLFCSLMIPFFPKTQVFLAQSRYSIYILYWRIFLYKWEWHLKWKKHINYSWEMIFKSHDLWENEKIVILKNKIVQIQRVYIPGYKNNLYVWSKNYLWKAPVRKWVCKCNFKMEIMMK